LRAVSSALAFNRAMVFELGGYLIGPMRGSASTIRSVMIHGAFSVFAAVISRSLLND
jgi:hypothetical protein